MLKFHKINLRRIVVFASLTIGIILILLSGFYTSSFMAILGVTFGFWAGVFLYITPSKHVPLSILSALTKAYDCNIERILNELEWTNKAIYLPQKNLKNKNSSLILITKTTNILPKAGEIPERLFSENKNNLFLTPPGQFLAQLFEKKLKTSFTQTNLNYVQKSLPKLLIEDLDIAENVEITFKDKQILVELTSDVFGQLYKDTTEPTQTKQQVGCLISSALACVLAKVTDKPLIIQKEICNTEKKIITIEYRLLED